MSDIKPIKDFKCRFMFHKGIENLCDRTLEELTEYTKNNITRMSSVEKAYILRRINELAQNSNTDNIFKDDKCID